MVSSHMVIGHQIYGIIHLENGSQRVYSQLDRMTGSWSHTEEALVCWLVHVHGSFKAVRQ